MTAYSNKNTSKRAAIVISPILALVIIHYAVIFPYSYLSSELPFRQAQFSRISQDVQQGILKPDSRGRVVLPPDLATATISGDVYVTHAPGGLILILCPTWWGRNWFGHRLDYRGYIYCSRPLTKADKNSIWSAEDSIVLNGPSIDTREKAPQKWQINTTGWFLNNEVSPDWYSVNSDDNEI
ncbi:MAG: hypothetical protein ACRYFS_26275 [Janthinobacterium lividum]